MQAPAPLGSAPARLLAKRGWETCFCSPPHTNTPEETALAEPGEPSEGAKDPLPAVCKELICQLSHQGVHILGGTLCLQSQVDLLQVSFLGNKHPRSGVSPQSRTQPQALSPSQKGIDSRSRKRQSQTQSGSRTFQDAQRIPTAQFSSQIPSFTHGHEVVFC